jgi:hypothetical protein
MMICLPRIGDDGILILAMSVDIDALSAFCLLSVMFFGGG